MKVEYVALLVRVEDDSVILSVGPFRTKAERDRIVSLLRVPAGHFIHCVERWTSMDGTVEEV